MRFRLPPALFLSPKTTELHVTRAYGQLDLHTRAALVERFADHAS